MTGRRLTLVLSLAGSGFVAPAGAQTRAGGEFTVNTTTTGYQGYPAIGRAPNGNFVVAWPDGRSMGILAQRFDRAGARLGAEFIVNTNAYSSSPAVAVGAKGEFVVAWFQDTQATKSIRARRFDASGNRLGGELAANTYTSEALLFPRVAIDGRGRFVVTWWVLDGSYSGISAQRFDAKGARLGSEFRANTYTTGGAIADDVAADAAGNFVVAWTGSDPGDVSAGVMGQRYDPNGTPRGAHFLINTYTTGVQAFPGIAYAPDGTFVVSYLTAQPGADGYDVMVKRYTGEGAVIGAEFQANSYTTGKQSYPSVATDSAGNFVVSWLDFAADGSYTGVSARRFLADGSARGNDFVVNTYTTGSQRPNRLATIIGSDQVGNFVVDWQGYSLAGDLDVFAQRFGGLHPHALRVDSTGNLVWEPGETVDVRPSWFNANGAAQTVGGVLARLTGPAGPTYTITDGAATYPTIANNASAGCTDCYQLSVSAPATRPAQHWDATAVETLTPDTRGQAMKWTLHVGASFNDVPTSNGFYRFIETLLHKGVTGGCGGTTFCPGDFVTREQIPVLALVAKEGAGYAPPACTTPVFNDVPASSGFCRFIEELARRGVVAGCGGGGSYCPMDPVTREQLAVILLGTLDPSLNPPACATPMFNDVPASSPFCRWIEELARRGVVTGCGGGNYCPTLPVTREQAAVFVSVTFGLTLYGI